MGILDPEVEAFITGIRRLWRLKQGRFVTDIRDFGHWNKDLSFWYCTARRLWNWSPPHLLLLGSQRRLVNGIGPIRKWYGEYSHWNQSPSQPILKLRTLKVWKRFHFIGLCYTPSVSTVFFHVLRPLFQILQIFTTTKTCGSSNLRKLIPAQETTRENYFQSKKPATGNLRNFSQEDLKSSLTGEGKPPTYPHCLTWGMFVHCYRKVSLNGRFATFNFRREEGGTWVKTPARFSFQGRMGLNFIFFMAFQNCLFFLAHSKWIIIFVRWHALAGDYFLPQWAVVAV